MKINSIKCRSNLSKPSYYRSIVVLSPALVFSSRLQPFSLSPPPAFQSIIQNRPCFDFIWTSPNQHKAVEKNRETLSQLKALNSEQERDMERVHQHDKLLAKVESMKKKLSWLKYDMKKAEYLEAKNQEKDTKKKLIAVAKILNELKEPIGKRKKEKGEQDSKCKKLRDLLDNVEKSRKQMLEKENQLKV